MTRLRLPLIHRADLDPVQRDLYDDMHADGAIGFEAPAPEQNWSPSPAKEARPRAS